MEGLSTGRRNHAAEGHNHVITGTTVRSLGLVLQYNFTGDEVIVPRVSSTKGFFAQPKLHAPGSFRKGQEEVYCT